MDSLLSFPHYDAARADNIIPCQKPLVTSFCIQKLCPRASLVAQWLGVHLPMQGTQVRALVWEDPTCRGATGSVCHNCWACALEPAHLDPVLPNGGGHHSERPMHRSKEWPPLASTREKPKCSSEDPVQPKIKNKLIKKKKEFGHLI